MTLLAAPVLVVHTRTVWSPEQVAIFWPSELKQARSTGPR